MVLLEAQHQTLILVVNLNLFVVVLLVAVADRLRVIPLLGMLPLAVKLSPGDLPLVRPALAVAVLSHGLFRVEIVVELFPVS